MSRPLYQALRSIDHDTFELLITQLLKEQYPNVDIQHIDGKSGDTGLDIITGQLDERPTIWQCKHFTNGIKDAQKQQIRDSLNEALKHYTPKRWVLCIPIDMDAPTLRWFQHLVASRTQQTEIKLYAANDIVRELLYSHAIREAYFPATVINVPTLREHLAGTNTLTDHELATLTENNIQSTLARLEAKDATYRYEITHARNGKPTTRRDDGALLTVHQGDHLITVYPRDTQALRQNPPGATIRLRGTGIEKFQDVHRTGRPHKFTSDEIVSMTSDFDHLFPHDRTGMTLEVSPHPTTENIPLRITFGTGEHADTYDYVPFRKTHAGTEEATIQNSNNLPLHITIVIRTNNISISINFTDNTIGQPIDSTLRLLNAIITALTTGHIECYHLEKGAVFIRGRLASAVPEWITQTQAFLVDLQAVSSAYGIPLIVPKTITDKDWDTFQFLKNLRNGMDNDGGEADVELVQLNDDDSTLRRTLFQDMTMRLERPGLPDLTLFGTPVATGPIRYSIPKARFNNPQAVKDFLDTAPLGATTHATLTCDGPIHLERITETTNP